MIIPEPIAKKIIRIAETHNISIENVIAIALENFLHEILQNDTKDDDKKATN